ncbi:hypothetical protein MtrunA17_Chr2g0307511 [Medicago truncatula]|uniref:Uncharacterized protein n=1 Tax=Medicago truncatula TaxID=3880 RepID=A0A396J7Y6_MEDTR|nr:hypothetical protein MtrunA17_Chr2g0307511 [Medicago truncatula]
MQGPGFEPRTPHFSTFKMCELQPLSYLIKKKKDTCKLVVIQNQ